MQYPHTSTSGRGMSIYPRVNMQVYKKAFYPLKPPIFFFSNPFVSTFYFCSNISPLHYTVDISVQIRDEVVRSLTVLRPNAVALVDAWDWRWEDSNIELMKSKTLIGLLLSRSSLKTKKVLWRICYFSNHSYLSMEKYTYTKRHAYIRLSFSCRPSPWTVNFTSIVLISFFFFPFSLYGQRLSTEVMPG